MIAAALSAFTKFAARIEPRSPILPVARPAYALMGVLAIADLVYVGMSDFEWGFGPYTRMLLVLAVASISALVARRYQMLQVASYLEATSFIGLVGLLTICSTLIGAAWSGQFIDTSLIEFDRLFGFDWLSVYRYSRVYPEIVFILNISYSSLFLQMVTVPALLTLFGEFECKWTFITAWTVASILTVLIFPFTPAEGAPIHFSVGPDAWSSAWFWQFGPRIAGLRAGALRDISSTAMGIVSVPSFHAAAGVMLAWASLRLRSFRIPFVLLNLLMIASTPISGVHYLVDVLAGMVEGAVSVILARILINACESERFRGDKVEARAAS